MFLYCVGLGAFCGAISGVELYIVNFIFKRLPDSLRRAITFIGGCAAVRRGTNLIMETSGFFDDPL